MTTKGTPKSNSLIDQALMILESAGEGDGSPAENINQSNAKRKIAAQESEDEAAKGGEGTVSLKTPSEKPDAKEKAADKSDDASTQAKSTTKLQEAKKAKGKKKKFFWEDQNDSPTAVEPDPDAEENSENKKAAQISEADKPGEVQPDDDDYPDKLASGALAEDEDEDSDEEDLDEAEDDDEDSEDLDESDDDEDEDDEEDLDESDDDKDDEKDKKKGAKWFDKLDESDDDEDDEDDLDESDDDEDEDDELTEDQNDSPTAVEPDPDAEQNPSNAKGAKSAKPKAVSEDEDSEEDDEEDLDEAEDESDEDEEKAKKEIKEHVDALFKGQTTLTEDFKARAATIFEAAIVQSTKNIRKQLNEEFEKKLARQSKRHEKNLVEKIDGYLGYVVEEWYKDNKVGIEQGLRQEITEGFIQDLQGVFQSHFIEVPKGKKNLLEDMAKAVVEYDAKLNKMLTENVNLKTENKKILRRQVVNDLTEDLSSEQAERVKTLSEGVTFTTAREFAKQVETIKEAYLGGKSSKRVVLREDVSPESTGDSNPAAIEANRSRTTTDKYVEALDRLTSRE